jgi:hypothetical protein
MCLLANGFWAQVIFADELHRIMIGAVILSRLVAASTFDAADQSSITFIFC